MQSLARWRGAGCVQVDTSAPRNFPRYSLTPTGLKAWKEVVAAAREKFQGFLEVPDQVIGGKGLVAQASSLGIKDVHQPS